ncbi:DNA-3-methyladenine glycosylase family protein [[Clostridium] dakarense]|uniref:DNA-3-methyladenine glycosylase family protein n=1 Tax=Faecalimicrobium dakarense TaxID=1301100 RepID=UPI0004B455B6|nr:DNA glycosylase [[Clostridium] dakarense]
MDIYEKDNMVVVENICDFHIDQIFDSGQGFRWKKQDDNSYTCVVKGKIINVSQIGNVLYLRNTNIDDFKNLWYKYFSLDVDYSSIKDKISKIDDNLKDAVEFGHGLRILDHDEWEMLITFILSTNNSIQMVTKVIDTLCERYGDYIGEYEGEKYYAFPTPQKLASLSLDELRECKTGFRDKYIKSVSEIVSTNQLDLYSLSNLDSDDCINNLKSLSGVGMKVADCIAMFSMRKCDIFPVDIWMKRVMTEFYLDTDMSIPKIRSFAIEKFGYLSSYVQQYLFYYAREKNIGK